jgi:hypothetical protein
MNILTSRDSKKYCRRTFLAGLGLGPGLLPILGADVWGGCLAAPPRRAVFVIWTNGYQEWVTGTETDWQFPAYMRDLDPYKSDLIPIKGVKYQNLIDTPNPTKDDNFGHGATTYLLTGKAAPAFRPVGGAGVSLDQYIAQQLVAKGVKVPRPSIYLGALQCYSPTCWRAAGQPVSPVNDPVKAFADIFAGAAPQMADPLLGKLRAAQKSILDLAQRDLNTFRARVGTEDKKLIDAHLGSIRDLESRFAPVGPLAAGCAPPTLASAKYPLPVSGDNINYDASYGAFPALVDAQMEIIVKAMAADVTRVAVLQLGDMGNNWLIPTWLGVKPAGTNQDGKMESVGNYVWDLNNHHTAAHKGGDMKRTIDQWFCLQFANLVGKLKGEREGTGTMLDNSVALFINHMGNGGGHTRENVPWLLAGRNGGYFKTGRNVQVTNIVHHAVHKEVAASMGVDNLGGFLDPKYDLALPALRG